MFETLRESEGYLVLGWPGVFCVGPPLLFILLDADFNIFTLEGQVSRKSLVPRNNL